MAPNQGTVEQLKEQARSTAAETKQTVKDAAGKAAERLREEGESWTTRQTSRAADEISHLGRAMRQAAASLHDESGHGIAAAVELAAERAEQTSDYLRHTDRQRLQSDVRQFARRRPEVFFGGMFLAGLAISRVLKAAPLGSEIQRRRPEDPSSPGSTWEEES